MTRTSRMLASRQGFAHDDRTRLCRCPGSPAAVFYSIAIIVVAYPDFRSRQSKGVSSSPWPDGGVRPARRLLFSMIVGHAHSLVFPRVRRSANRLSALTRAYPALTLAIDRRWVTVAIAALALTGTCVLTRAIGSEFLPHLDEGAIWVRGTLAPSTGPTEGIRVANQVRQLRGSFPEVTVATSQVGRPDDGTDTTGFFNTEYFVDLKPKEDWRAVFRQDKEALIAAMNRELRRCRAPSAFRSRLPTTWKRP